MNARRIGDLTWRLANMSDLKAMIPIVAESYKERPPTHHALHVNMEHCIEASKAILPSNLQRGRAWIIETGEGTIASFMLGSDFSEKPSMEWLQFLDNHPHFRELERFKAALEERYAKHHDFTIERFPRNHTFYLKFCGTSKCFRGMGLMRKVYDVCLKDLAQDGYTYAIGLSANKQTRRQRINRKTELLFSRQYDEYFVDDPGYARCIAAGEDGITVIVDDLRNWKDGS